MNLRFREPLLLLVCGRGSSDDFYWENSQFFLYSKKFLVLKVDDRV